MLDWLEENSPTLTMLLAATTILFAVLLGLALLRLRAWRDKNRTLIRAERHARHEAASASRLSGDASTQLAQVADWQASAFESLAIVADHARERGDQETAVSLTIAQGALRRAQAVLDSTREHTPPAEIATSLEYLLDSVGQLGLRVQKIDVGARRPLRPGVEAAVYAVLREALQNAVQHGGTGFLALVRFSWIGSGFHLYVQNGPADTPLMALEDVSAADLLELEENMLASSGFGMTVMRDHVERFGGLFHARALPEHGFAVSAMFPNAFADSTLPRDGGDDRPRVAPVERAAIS